MEPRRTVQAEKAPIPYELSAMPWEAIQRRAVPTVQPYINEVKNVVEVRKPTIDEMKQYFLILLQTDNDIVEAVRRLI